MRVFYFPILLLIIGLSACNNPLNKKYNEATLSEDGRAIRESKKLSDDDSQLIVAYILRAKLKGEELSNMTYAEILKKAKDAKAEQKELADKAAKEDEEKRIKLGQAVNVALYDLGFDKREYEDYIVYSMAFENKTDKDIKAVKGSLAINNLFGDEIKTINIVFDDGVKANSTYKTSYTTDFNQFRAEDQQLKSKTIDQIKAVWTPEKIIFADGSTLE